MVLQLQLLILLQTEKMVIVLLILLFLEDLTYISGGVDVDITSGISLLTTVQRSENGDSIESIDNIKYLAPRVYASQYRAVTPNDYKSLIPFLYPNIDSVSAYGGEELDPIEFGKVYITVKPKMVNFCLL